MTTTVDPGTSARSAAERDLERAGQLQWTLPDECAEDLERGGGAAALPYLNPNK